MRLQAFYALPFVENPGQHPTFKVSNAQLCMGGPSLLLLVVVIASASLSCVSVCLHLYFSPCFQTLGCRTCAPV